MDWLSLIQIEEEQESDDSIDASQFVVSLYVDYSKHVEYVNQFLFISGWWFGTFFTFP